MAKNWKVVHLDLTEDQIARGVIYSSVLKVTNHPEIKNVLHEVFRTDPHRGQQIANLQDTSFFERMAADFGYHVINEVRY